MKFQIKLPIPPSANELTRWRKDRSRPYPTQEKKDYEIIVAQLWMIARLEPILVPYKLLIDVYNLPKRRDIGNLEKITSDALQKCGAIKNDNQCRGLLVLPYGVTENEEPHIWVTVWDDASVQFWTREV